MVNLFGCSGVKFEKYSSKDPLINISMDYISGWQYDETRGSYSSYAQVMFFPFKKGQKSPKTIMVVTVKDSSRMEFTPLTVEAAADDLLAKRMQFKEARVLSKSKMKLLNTEAIAIELSYLTLGNLLSVNSKLIPVKEKVIIFKKNNNFYFLRYENSAEEFDKYSSAFMHMVKTIKIKDNK
jgi:hypothetical protein